MTETLQIIEKRELTPPKSEPRLGEYIADFLLIKHYELKPKSVKTYTESLNQLILYFGSDRPINTITEPDLMAWIEQLKQTRTPSGVFQLWQTATFFFKWYFTPDPAANPMQRIHLKRPKKDPIKGIEPEQVQKILKVIDGRDKTRDRAIISVLFSSGLRKAEFCGLKIDDVNLTTGAISVTADNAKRSKFRVIHISGKALLNLNRYVKTLKDQPGTAALWQAASGKPLTPKGIEQILIRAENAANLPEFFDFHDFRRGCALTMSRKGADIKTISHFLGHSDLKTTERYIALDDQDTARAAILFDPLK